MLGSGLSTSLHEVSTLRFIRLVATNIVTPRLPARFPARKRAAALVAAPVFAPPRAAPAESPYRRLSYARREKRKPDRLPFRETVSEEENSLGRRHASLKRKASILSSVSSSSPSTAFPRYSS